MSQILKSLFNYIEEPVLIYDKKHDTLHQNNAFSKVFYSFKPENWRCDIKKLEYKLHFELCMLESDKLKTYTPIMATVESKLEFSTSVIFQKDNNNFLYFVIKTARVGNYKLIYFYDTTQKLKLEKLELENKNLKIQNQQFAIMAPKAQNQAVKMALLNRISNSLRTSSIDINTLIDTALKELSIIFGANKAYFAKEINKEFEVEYSHPNATHGEKLVYDKKILEDIFGGKNSFSITLKEHDNSRVHLPYLQTRIIMPVLVNQFLFGIIVIFTSQKEIPESEKEILVSISNQISGAILQVNLFRQIYKKSEELECTIAELKETQLQLINSEKMASLGQLIANVAHEINTPLASISANNEIMEKLFEKHTIPQFSELLFDVNSIDKEAIKRITNLVKSLKRFVRLDETEQQEADINSELDLTLELLRHKTKNSIEIVKKYGDIPMISCYPNMLNQVFLNIISNSIDGIKAIDKSGEILIETMLEGNFLLVKITDNGAGIEEKNQLKVFDAGFTTKKIGEGTGLGLAICKKIIDKHNGEINFESRYEKTVFAIKIPVL